MILIKLNKYNEWMSDH